MLDHVGVPCADLEAASDFYDAVLGALGHTRLLDYGVARGWGTGKPDFWLSAAGADGSPGGAADELHLAFEAPDAAAVHAFFEAAVALGAEVLHEPRHWPEYHAHYYGAFVRDPDGNNVEAVCHTVPPAGG